MTPAKLASPLCSRLSSCTRRSSLSSPWFCQAREAEESAEASRRTSFASTPMTGLSPADVPSLGLQPSGVSSSIGSSADVPMYQSDQTAVTSHLHDAPTAGDGILNNARGGTRPSTGTAASTQHARQVVQQTVNPQGMTAGQPFPTPSSHTQQQDAASVPAAAHQNTITRPPIAEPSHAATPNLNPATFPTPGQSGSHDAAGSPSEAQHGDVGGSAASDEPADEPASHGSGKQLGHEASDSLSGRLREAISGADLEVSGSTNRQCVPCLTGRLSVPEASEDVPERPSKASLAAGLTHPESKNGQGSDAPQRAAGREAQEELVGRLAQASGAAVGPGSLGRRCRGTMHAHQGSVPIAAVVGAYILDPILAQHRCVSQACVRSAG